MSHPPPLIGITVYGPEGKLPSYSLPAAYGAAVADAGGIPVLLPAEEGPLAATVDRLDGLVLAGGGDLDPACHGGRSHPTVYLVTPERDRFELDLTRRALERRLPLLGICRGMQVLNVALGGDLELHLPDRVGEAVKHRLPPREPTFHPVRLAPGSVLASIYERQEFEVCSWHHQGVRRLGHGLEPIAHAPDGVIEALVHVDQPFVVGVQWHPEMQVENDPLQRRIFEALVGRAREGA